MPNKRVFLCLWIWPVLRYILALSLSLFFKIFSLIQYSDSLHLSLFEFLIAVFQLGFSRQKTMFSLERLMKQTLYSLNTKLNWITSCMNWKLPFRKNDISMWWFVVPMFFPPWPNGDHPPSPPSVAEPEFIFLLLLGGFLFYNNIIL